MLINYLEKGASFPNTRSKVPYTSPILNLFQALTTYLIYPHGPTSAVQHTQISFFPIISPTLSLGDIGYSDNTKRITYEMNIWACLCESF